MALADYYLCDTCGCKTFYDADICYKTFNDVVGQIKVICPECNKKYEILIKEKEKTNEV